MVEHRCADCGERYAGPPDQATVRCRVCGGPLLDEDEDEWPPGPVAPWAELPDYLREGWLRYWTTPDPDTGRLPARPTRRGSGPASDHRRALRRATRAGVVTRSLSPSSPRSPVV